MTDILETLAAEIASLKRELSDIKSQLSKEAIPLAPGSGGTGTSVVLTQGSVPFIGASGVFTEDATNLRYDDTDDVLLVGSTASKTDFPLATGIVSSGNSGHTYDQNIGFVGEAAASGSLHAVGIGGVASTSGSKIGRGSVGRGVVGASADTADCIGLHGLATATHAGGSNIGVYGQASGGSSNYSFYGINGYLYNAAGVGFGTAPGSTYIVDSKGLIHAYDVDTSAGFYARAYGASSALPTLGMFRARGSIASPTAVQSGDTLGALQFGGLDAGGTWRARAAIYGAAAENWGSAANLGTYLTLHTTPTGSTTLTERARINAAGDLLMTLCGLTVEGGFYVAVTAQETLYRGEVVSVIQGAGGSDRQVKKTPTSGNENDMPIGVVYANVAAGSTAYIVTSGIAYVLPTAAVAPVRGYVITASTTTAGRVDQAATVPAAATHFKEVGHYIESASAGVAARAVIHFN